MCPRAYQSIYTLFYTTLLLYVILLSHVAISEMVQGPIMLLLPTIIVIYYSTVAGSD